MLFYLLLWHSILCIKMPINQIFHHFFNNQSFRPRVVARGDSSGISKVKNYFKDIRPWNQVQGRQIVIPSPCSSTGFPRAIPKSWLFVPVGALEFGARKNPLDWPGGRETCTGGHKYPKGAQVLPPWATRDLLNPPS